MMKASELYRDEMLSVLYDMANELVDNFTWPKLREISRLACDWNSTHDGETEIFVSDWTDRNGAYLAIEDDYFNYEE